MKNKVKFLHFKDTELLLTELKKTTYVAIRPVFEALNVDYKSKYYELRKYDFFSQNIVLIPVKVNGKKTTPVLFIEQMYVYALILCIDRKNKNIVEVKKELYEFVFNYFRFGPIIKTDDVLISPKSNLASAFLQLRLLKNDDYIELLYSENKLKHIDAALKRLD